MMPIPSHVKMIGVFASLWLAPAPVYCAPTPCYDLGESLARWEGLVTEANQSRSTYQKYVNGRVQKNNERVLRRWAKAGANPSAIDERGALRQAVSSCYPKALQILLDHGVNPNTPLDGDSPLRTAIGSVVCDESSRAAVVTELLNKGATPDAADGTGQTALMRAALAGHGEIVDLLVTHGAHVGAVDCARRTALHWAAAAGEPAAVEALLRHGASPEAKDIRGATPRALTVQFSHRPLGTMARYADYQRTFDLLGQAEAGAPLHPAVKR